MIKPKVFHHAALRVRDLEGSRRFYEEIVGLKTIPRPDFGFPGVWYGLGGNQLHLMAPQRAAGDLDPTNPHLAIEVDDFDETKRFLSEKGIPFLEMAGVSGRQLWIKDPDGYLIELRSED